MLIFSSERCYHFASTYNKGRRRGTLSHEDISRLIMQYLHVTGLSETLTVFQEELTGGKGVISEDWKNGGDVRLVTLMKVLPFLIFEFPSFQKKI